MSNPKHTPGPWKLYDYGTNLDVEVGDSGKVIASIPNDTDETQGEVESNARLIAAAPELIKACEALKAAYDNGEKSGSIEWDDLDFAYDLAQKAISKAAGNKD